MRPTVPRFARGGWKAAITLVALGGVSTARPAAAQGIRTLTACTPDALAVCAQLRLTAGPSVFEVGIRALGATSSPTQPVSVYNLVFGTGAAPDAAGGVGVSVAPVGVGGAVVNDASAWDLFDAGNAIFLSALTNFGVGGCVAGGPVDGFGQAARTCGAGEFVTFSYTPTTAFDPRRFTLLDLEAVGLTAGLPAASCGAAGRECVITADMTVPATPALVPEPATLALLGTGLLLTGLTARRRARK